MTEKRKRGRPKGSGSKKLEIQMVNPVSTQVAAAVHNAEHSDQFTQTYDLTPEAAKELVDIKLSQLKSGYAKIGKSIDTEKLIPPAGLSKTEILTWYTKQNAKK
jgi:hypothetical protein